MRPLNPAAEFLCFLVENHVFSPVRRGQLGLEVRQPLGPRLVRAVQRGLQRGLARRELLETTEGCSSKLRCTLENCLCKTRSTRTPPGGRVFFSRS